MRMFEADHSPYTGDCNDSESLDAHDYVPNNVRVFHRS
jgi:hypothetical protein